MSLQFYLGRAGSGKSRRCRDEIVERLKQNPSPLEGGLYWLLPEQATSQAERDLLSAPGIRGFTRARVFSFRRLAQLILSEYGRIDQPFLDEQERRMLLRALVARHRDELRLFPKSAREAGFIDRLAETFRELAQFRHSVADLEAQAKRLESMGGESRLSMKLHDLALIGRAWEREVGDRFSNPDRWLDALAERIAASGVLEGAEIWIDGFASFMPQEMRVLEQVMRRAKAVRVTLLLEPARLDRLPEAPAELDLTELFNPTEETYLRLKAAAIDSDVEIIEPLCLPAHNQPGRFDAASALHELEQNLFSSGMIPQTKPQANDDWTLGLPEEMGPLTLVEAGGYLEEVEATARTIRRLCRREGYRYRDIGLLMRSHEPYHPLIRSVFSRYGIPFFIDRRRGMAHHPLVELIRSSIRTVLEDWSFDNVSNYLKTDFAPVSRDVADQIENAAYMHGIRGMKRWLDRWPEKAMILAVDDDDRKSTRLLDPHEERQKALRPLADLQDRLKAGGDENIVGKTFVATVVEFLEKLNCSARLEKWSEAARASGHLDLAGEHEQVWTAVTALLAQVKDTLEGESMSLRDWAEVLESGLSSLTLGLVPPSLDQVLVGSVDRSREPSLRALFVLGMNDRVFPFYGGEDVIFTDRERTILDAEGSLELGPTSTLRYYRERYLGYVALTRASEKLWASYAAADDDGKPLLPSSYVQVLLECAKEIRKFKVRSEWLLESIDAAELPVHAIEGILHGLSRTDGAESAWSALDAYREQIPGADVLVSRAERQRNFSYRCELSLSTSQAMLDSKSSVSVSRLESYGKCPFQYFSRYVLNLEQRTPYRVQAQDVGSFHHGLLHEVYNILAAWHDEPNEPGSPIALVDRFLSWKNVSQDEAEAALDDALEKLRPEFLSDSPLTASQVSFFLSRSRRTVLHVLKSFITQAKRDQFRQAAAELSFGFSRSKTDAFHLPLSTGETLRLRGKIDRVDLAYREGKWHVRIIDFKSSEQTLKLGGVLNGLSLQLPVYLAALLDAAPAICGAGVFYYPVRQVIQKGDPPCPNQAPDQETCIRMRGAFDLAALQLFDQISEGETSSIVAAQIIKGGKCGARTADWLESRHFGLLLSEAKRMAGRLADKMKSGHIHINPCRVGKWTPCSQCEYASFCRIQPHSPNYRNLPDRNRKEAIAHLEALCAESA